MKDKRKTVRILSVNVDSFTLKELTASLEKRLDEGRRTVIFTPNTQMLLRAEQDSGLCRLLKGSDINIPDGIGLIMASRLLGSPLPERIAGIDLAEELIRLSADKGLSVFLLGGKGGNARRAERRLCVKYPLLRVCGCHNGYFTKCGEENERVLRLINKAHPRLLFVCLGSPAQEQWIADNISRLPSVKLAIGLGGSIDVWAGAVKRAPAGIQALGLEWMWRAMLQPKRMRILADIPHFFYLIEKQKKRSRRNALSVDF